MVQRAPVAHRARPLLRTDEPWWRWLKRGIGNTAIRATEGRCLASAKDTAVDIGLPSSTHASPSDSALKLSCRNDQSYSPTMSSAFAAVSPSSIASRDERIDCGEPSACGCCFQPHAVRRTRLGAAGSSDRQGRGPAMPSLPPDRSDTALPGIRSARASDQHARISAG